MKGIIQALILVSLILIAGCGKPVGDTQPNPNSVTTPSSVVTEPSQPQNSEPIEHSKKMTVNLYFPDQDAIYLVKVPKEITVVDGAIVKAIIAELQKGTPDHGKVIPQEAKLLKASVKDGIVQLDFSKEFKEKHWGGSTGEGETIYGIVNSLTELPNIKAVQFYLEGQIQAEMMGHYDWSQPFTRNENMIKK
jgi:germination protein M